MNIDHSSEVAIILDKLLNAQNWKETYLLLDIHKDTLFRDNTAVNTIRAYYVNSCLQPNSSEYNSDFLKVHLDLLENAAANGPDAAQKQFEQTKEESIKSLETLLQTKNWAETREVIKEKQEILTAPITFLLLSNQVRQSSAQNITVDRKGIAKHLRLLEEVRSSGLPTAWERFEERLIEEDQQGEIDAKHLRQVIDSILPSGADEVLESFTSDWIDMSLEALSANLTDWPTLFHLLHRRADVFVTPDAFEQAQKKLNEARSSLDFDLEARRRLVLRLVSVLQGLNTEDVVNIPAIYLMNHLVKDQEIFSEILLFLKKNIETQPTQTYGRHSSSLTCLSWSPDGRRVASGGTDRTVHIWASGTGTNLARYAEHKEAVFAVAWSPNGRKIASASSDGVVEIWDAMTSQHHLSYNGHSGLVYSLDWTPDGQWLVSASEDCTVQVWNTATGTLRLTYYGHIGAVRCAKLSPDGRKVASAGDDTFVKVWEVSTGKTSLSYNAHSTFVTSVDWSPDGQLLASSSIDVHIWDTSTGSTQLTYSGHTHGIFSVAWSPDGQLIASAGADRTLQVWDAKQGSFFWTYRGHIDVINGVSWSPDGRYIATSSWDGNAHVWNMSRDEPVYVYREHDRHAIDMDWSPDSRYLVSVNGDKVVRVCDANGQHVMNILGITESAHHIAWSPNGQFIAISGNLKIHIINLHNSTQQCVYQEHEEPISSLVWSPDSSRIASSSAFHIHVWNSVNGQHQLKHEIKNSPNSISSVAWSPDGKYIVATVVQTSGNRDNANPNFEIIQVRDVTAINIVLIHSGHSDVSWSPDSAYLVTGGKGSSAQVWELSTRSPIYTYHGHSEPIRSLVWSPNSQRIASVSNAEDDPVHVWDAFTGNHIYTYRGHKTKVHLLAWSPDGKKMASTSGSNILLEGFPDFSVHIWPVK